MHFYSKIPEFFFVYVERKWLRIKVKENREILRAYGCLPGKMPNGCSLAESHPATSVRDWSTTRQSSKSLKIGWLYKLFITKVPQPDLIVKY